MVSVRFIDGNVTVLETKLSVLPIEGQLIYTEFGDKGVTYSVGSVEHVIFGEDHWCNITVHEVSMGVCLK